MMKFEKCLKKDLLKLPPGGDDADTGEGEEGSDQGGEGG